METENRGLFPGLNNVSAKIAFSPACNFSCVYCGGSKDRVHAPTPALMEDYRATNIKTGIIPTDKLLGVLQGLYDAGVRSIRPTGGEPMLRKDWDVVVDGAAQMGFKGVDVTTNGSLLPRYLQQHKGKLPEGLTTMKVSFDTESPERFKYLTGGGDLNLVARGIKAIADQVYVRANKVFLMSEATVDHVKSFVTYCKNLGMKQIMYLDLVHYPNAPKNNPSFWKNEFAGFDVFSRLMRKAFRGTEFTRNTNQFGVDFHQAKLQDGFIVSFKDSRRTMRDKQCGTCPEFCQEGRTLLRVGTDSNTTFCPDYKAEMPHFNAAQALINGTFMDKMREISRTVDNSTKSNTLKLFRKKHDL